MAWGNGKWSLSKAIKGLVSRAEIDDQTWEDLEDTFLSADFGPAVTESLLASVRAEVERIGTTNHKRRQGHRG